MSLALVGSGSTGPPACGRTSRVSSSSCARGSLISIEQREVAVEPFLHARPQRVVPVEAADLLGSEPVGDFVVVLERIHLAERRDLLAVLIAQVGELRDE